MSTGTDSNPSKIWQIICWMLRITVALQCLGNWRWLTQRVETPLLHWLVSPTDVGGLAWAEPTALVTQQVVGWSLLAAAALVLLRPHALILWLLAGLQLLVTIAMWRLAEGYSLQLDWASPQLLTLFPFATQPLRIAAPLALMWTVTCKTTLINDSLAKNRVILLLRWATAIVFLAHGIEACQHNPKFIDLLINANRRMLGLEISQNVAELCLTWIGRVDIILAILCVIFRWKSVFYWFALWGGITAASRGFANSWTEQWHEVFIRLPHFGVPLAVALLLKCQVCSDSQSDRSTEITKAQSAQENSP